MAITQSPDRRVEQETTTEQAERDEMFTIHPEILGAAGPMPRPVEDGEDAASADATAP